MVLISISLFNFSDDGLKSSGYKAGDFIFNSVDIVDISDITIHDLIIRSEHLNFDSLDDNADFLIIKTGFTNKRYQDEYWEKGYGFHPETANHIKQHFPQIKAIGFDLISLNSYQHRPLGREAHKAFLVENNILIIEELDLRNLDATDKIKTLIAAPLLLENADGAPCTILIDTYED